MRAIVKCETVGDDKIHLQRAFPNTFLLQVKLAECSFENFRQLND